MTTGGKCSLCGLGMGTYQPPPTRSGDYQRGWDDCLKRVYDVLGEKFTRPVVRQGE